MCIYIDEKMSKRAFDGRIKAWRRALHKWDPNVADQDKTDLNDSFDGDISIQSGSVADNKSHTPHHVNRINDVSSGAKQKLSSNQGVAQTVTPDTVTDSSIVSAGENNKDILGGQLYPLIFTYQPELAAKITGMLLELDNDEIKFLISSPDDLLNRIGEAVQLLSFHMADKNECVYAMGSERETLEFSNSSVPVGDTNDDNLDQEDDDDDVL